MHISTEKRSFCLSIAGWPLYDLFRIGTENLVEKITLKEYNCAKFRYMIMMEGKDLAR